MNKTKTFPPPKWLFAILQVGAFIACGIYLGIGKAEGFSTGISVRVIAFAVFGFLMLWGVLGKR